MLQRPSFFLKMNLFQKKASSKWVFFKPFIFKILFGSFSLHKKWIKTVVSIKTMETLLKWFWFLFWGIFFLKTWKLSFEKQRGCLVYVFKQQFSVFKQHFTYFNALFHPHVFPQIFLNNNFQFLNTHTKRAQSGFNLKLFPFKIALF